MKAKARRILARKHERFLVPHEARFSQDYRKVMAELRSDLGTDPKITDALVEKWKKRTVEAMRPAYLGTILGAGRDFLTRTLSLRKALAEHYTTKAARKRVADVVVSIEEQFADRLEETVDTTFEALQDILDEAVADDLDDDEVADLIEEEWGDIMGRRTDAIATTEVNGAANAVREYLMREVVELQSWVTAGDERVRPTHVIYGEAGPKPVGFDWSQLVDDAGYTLRFPCDPECHEPAEVINCRCFTVPQGEVDMDPAELRDYLEDFEMTPDDVMLSEDQEPVYVTNAYTGKTIKGDFEGHPFRGNQYSAVVSGGDDTTSAKVTFGMRTPIDGPYREDEKALAESLFSTVREHLKGESMPAAVARFADRIGLKVEFEPNPKTVVIDGQEAIQVGTFEYDPRLDDPAILTLTADMAGQDDAVIGHEIGHMMNQAALFAAEYDGDNEAGARYRDAAQAMNNAFQFEGGVTDYAQSFIGEKWRFHRMVSRVYIGPSEQFAEIEGMFQHATRRSKDLFVGTSEDKLVDFAVALARGKHGRLGADSFPGFTFGERPFPRSARAWLQLRGVKDEVLNRFDERVKVGQKRAPALVRKGDVEGHPFRGNQWTEGQGGGGGEDKPAPKDFNRDPASFEPLVWGKTQTGEKREAAIKKAEAQLEEGITMKGGDKGDLHVQASRADMEARLEALFEDAQSDPAIMAHADWYEKEAGAVVDNLHAKYAEFIPGLGKDQVAGILAASSANNIWDDKWGTPEQRASSNQVVAERILQAWAGNARVVIAPEHLALAQAYMGEHGLTKGMYKGITLPEPGEYTFQELAKADPRLGFLFHTSWQGAEMDPKTGKPMKVAPESGGGAMGFGGMPGHVVPSLGLLRGDSYEDVYGSEGKVRSFVTNITRAMTGQKDDNVTLDVWMARAMFGHPGIEGAHFGSFAPTAARYEYLRSIVADLAKKHGMQPKQYQAVVWYALRNGRNKWDDRADVKEWAAKREAAKMSAKAAKRAARPSAAKAKAFEPYKTTPEEDVLLAWLQRFLAHERGEDVSGDPFFGPWDEEDEATAKEWRSRIGSVAVSKGILTFVYKGDFEGHPFRGNQWTSGYSQAKGDEDKLAEAKSEYEDKLALAQEKLEPAQAALAAAKVARDAAIKKLMEFEGEAQRIAQKRLDDLAMERGAQGEPLTADERDAIYNRYYDEAEKSLPGMEKAVADKAVAVDKVVDAERDAYEARMNLEELEQAGPKGWQKSLDAAKERQRDASDRMESLIKEQGKIDDAIKELEAKRAEESKAAGEAASAAYRAQGGTDVTADANEYGKAVARVEDKYREEYEAWLENRRINKEAMEVNLRKMAAAQKEQGELEQAGPYGNLKVGVIEPSRLGGPDERAEVLKASVERMKEDVPSPERMKELKAEEDAGFRNAPGVAEKHKAAEEAVAYAKEIETKVNEIDSKIAEKRDEAIVAGAKDAVESLLAAHPEIDFRVKDPGEEMDRLRAEVKANQKEDQSLTLQREALVEKARAQGLQALVNKIAEERPELLTDPKGGKLYSEEGDSRGVPQVGRSLNSRLAGEDLIQSYVAATTGESDRTILENRAGVLIDQAVAEQRAELVDPVDKRLAELANARADATQRLREIDIGIEVSHLASKGSYENAVGYAKQLDSWSQPLGKDPFDTASVRNDRPLSEYTNSQEHLQMQGERAALVDQLNGANNVASQNVQAAAEAVMKARDEFAVKAGPGYFFQRALEDPDYNEKHMDEMRGGWQHIGGEGPMRVRVATGIGLGLETGTIYDKKKGGFISTSEYGDLRDDYDTILWAGLIRKEYMETQEDIANGLLGKVEDLGERHMGGDTHAGDTSYSHGNEEDPDEWPDEKKYDMDKLRQDVYESDAWSNAEFEAMSSEYDDLTPEDKVDLITTKGYAGEVLAAAGRATAAQDNDSPWSSLAEVNQSSLAEQAEYLKAKLGEDYVPMLPSDVDADAAARRAAKVEKNKMIEETHDAALRMAIVSNAEKLLGEKMTVEVREKLQVALNAADDPTKYASATSIQNVIARALTHPGANAGLLQAEQFAISRIIPDAVKVADDESEAVATLPLSDPNIQARITPALIDDARESIAGESAAANWTTLASGLDTEEKWDLLKEEDIDDVYAGGAKPQKLQYSNGTLQEVAQERFRDNWTWEDSDAQEQIINDFKDAHGEDYYTDEYNEQKAIYDAAATSQPPSSKDPNASEDARIRGTVKIYRGIYSDPKKYVFNFTESWSTSRDKASDFGNVQVLEADMPIERILVFQGARNWAAKKPGGMGNTEYEVMPLSDMPKWYREAFREYMKAKKQAKKEAA